MKNKSFKIILGCFVTLLSIYLILIGFFICWSFDAPDLRIRRINISPEDVIGLTSLEIEEKYGDFNIFLHYNCSCQGDDGLYRSTTNGYVVKKETSDWAVWFTIKFDENGIAVEASEHIRPE